MPRALESRIAKLEKGDRGTDDGAPFYLPRVGWKNSQQRRPCDAQGLLQGLRDGDCVIFAQALTNRPL
jgi:hypothetical protein